MRAMTKTAKVVMAVGALTTAWAHGATYSWNKTATGTYNWDDSANWNATGLVAGDSLYANGVGAIANLTANLPTSALPVINLNTQITLGSLTIGDPNSAYRPYSVQPGTAGSLVFDNGTSDATLQAVNVASNLDNTISAGLDLQSNLVVSIPNTNRLLLSGAITGSQSLTKSGAGVLKLASNSNSFSGLAVQGGLVQASTTIAPPNQTTSYASPISMGTPFGSGSVTLSGGGRIQQLLSSGGPSGADFNYGLSAYDIALEGDGAIAHNGTARSIIMYSGLISGAGKLTLVNSQNSTLDPNALVLQHTNTYTGGTDLDTPASGTSSRALFVADAPNAFGGGISGTGGVVSFVNTNAAAAPLSPHSYLALKANQSIAGLSSSRGRTYLTGYSDSVTTVLTISNAAGGIGDGSNYVGVISAASVPGVAGITATQAAGDNLQLVKSGTGTQILSGLGTYTGGTIINGGILAINGGATSAPASRTGSTTASSTVIRNIDTTGLVVGQFVLGTSQTVAPQIVSIDAATNSIVVSGAFTLAGDGVPLSFSALGSAAGRTATATAATPVGGSSVALSSTEGLVVGQFLATLKSGNNIFISSGSQITSIDSATNTITLSTTSSKGIASGSTVSFLPTSGAGAGPVTVNTGGTLRGSGGIVGGVTVNSGGLVAPGNSIGTLSLLGSASLAGTLRIDIDDTGAQQADLLNVGGVLDITGATLDFSVVGTPSADAYVFATYNSLVGTFAADDILNKPIGYNVVYGYEGNQIALVAIPEPVAGALLATGGALLCMRRRRA